MEGRHSERNTIVFDHAVNGIRRKCCCKVQGFAPAPLRIALRCQKTEQGHTPLLQRQASGICPAPFLLRPWGGRGTGSVPQEVSDLVWRSRRRRAWPTIRGGGPTRRGLSSRFSDLLRKKGPKEGRRTSGVGKSRKERETDGPKEVQNTKNELCWLRESLR